MSGYPLVTADVEPHIPAEPTPASVIINRVGVWSPTSIRQALNNLADAGRIRRCTDTNRHGYPRPLYWRAPA